MFCICLILHILSGIYFAESFGAFYTLKFPSNTATNFCTSWKFWVIGLNSGKFLSLYLGPFSCKVQVLEKNEACLLLVQDFVYSNKSIVEKLLFFTFLSWKKTFLHMSRKYAYLNWNWSNTMKLPIIVFVGDSINKKS